jgi:hypothetical protein
MFEKHEYEMYHDPATIHFLDSSGMHVHIEIPREQKQLGMLDLGI